MHWMMIVTMNTNRAATSRAARERCSRMLSRWPSFVGEHDGAVCDWFVIGGRASGLLRATLRDRAARRTDRVLAWLRLAAVDALGRDRYRPLGYGDDAMVVDADLYRALLAGFAGTAARRRRGKFVFLDLDRDPVAPPFVGSKWLVVVDCHV